MHFTGLIDQVNNVITSWKCQICLFNNFTIWKNKNQYLVRCPFSFMVLDSLFGRLLYRFLTYLRGIFSQISLTIDVRSSLLLISSRRLCSWYFVTDQRFSMMFRSGLLAGHWMVGRLVEALYSPIKCEVCIEAPSSWNRNSLLPKCLAMTGHRLLSRISLYLAELTVPSIHHWKLQSTTFSASRTVEP